MATAVSQKKMTLRKRFGALLMIKRMQRTWQCLNEERMFTEQRYRIVRNLRDDLDSWMSVTRQSPLKFCGFSYTDVNAMYLATRKHVFALRRYAKARMKAFACLGLLLCGMAYLLSLLK